MLELFHAANSRSSSVVQLLDELGALDRVTIRDTQITRQDGSGAHDPANPHPESKVPVLVHDGAVITETNAIMLYLCDLFPDGGMGPKIGDPLRGPFLTWLAWYGNVVEPVLHFHMLNIDHPGLNRTFRGMAEVTARFENALDRNDHLLGPDYSAADLLLAQVFILFPALAPDNAKLRAWVARCADRPSVKRVQGAGAG